MDPKYTEPTGQLRDLVIKPKKNGNGYDILALDENNIVWIWDYFDGRWTANMSIEAGNKLGYLVNEGAINGARDRQPSPYRGQGLSAEDDSRQPLSNRGRFAER